MEDRVSITVYINPSVLKTLKIEAVYNDVTYSDIVSSRVREILSKYKMGEEKQFWSNYIKDKVPIKHRRPTYEFIQKHGPIQKKKASFYIDRKLRRQINKFLRHIKITLSDLVELALTVENK